MCFAEKQEKIALELSSVLPHIWSSDVDIFGKLNYFQKNNK